MWRLLHWLKPKEPDTSQKPAPTADVGLLNAARPDPAVADETQQALRQLERHLFCWLLDATPAQLEKPSPEAADIQSELTRRMNADGLSELPRQPAVLPMLIRALADEDVSRHALAEIILSDPALTVQLLHVANSPFFRPGEQQIESVEHAVFLLGLDGIRNVASAAVMRPMMTARNSQEALFAQRVWRWGLASARASELIAKAQGAPGNDFFMVGLIPALAYITLRREVVRLYRSDNDGRLPEPAVLLAALRANDWPVSQMIANRWDLPPRFHAHLMAAERPASRTPHTPLNDGIILGTREVLRQAHQRNLPEEKLVRALHLEPDDFTRIRHMLLTMLKDGQRL